MSFQYLTNVPLEDALKEYLNILKKQNFTYKTERISVYQSLHRICAKPVYATICSPHYNACAMDGIAVNSAKTFGATATTPVILTAEEYQFVDTGDPLPSNFDAVIMIEDVIKENRNVRIYCAAIPWQHIRQIGEDISAGDMLFDSYANITPAGIGAMLASGVREIEVIKKPLVGIIPTGDEIVSPEHVLKEGDIIEFNSAIFANMLKEIDVDTHIYPIVADKLENIINVIKKSVYQCDVVLVIAGSSAGREDFSAQAISQVGSVFLHGLAIKPGKPAILGYSGSVPILGIPGYPVSGIIVVQELLKPIINYIMCKRPECEVNQSAILSKTVVSSLKYQEFIRVKLGIVEERLIASPLNRGAGVVSSFIKADGLLIVPQNQEGYSAGDKVEVRLLRDYEEIVNCLLVCGSHDPLIDEVANLIKIRWKNKIGLSSSHVGSMGGIMAILRKEAHISGIHLLDEKDCIYNKSYVKRFFPEQEVLLIEGVKRQQGLIVAAKNPLKITSLADIIYRNLSYVNRQKGSGTRILLDYILKKEGLPIDLLKGYSREEFTHTNVAAVISAGSADAGMGIFSVTKMYGLDFIPLYEEDYDFIVTKKTFQLEAFQCFLQILKSREFRRCLNDMGGYRIDRIGEVINID